jgi:outer membrane lipoprotein-sorting protein
MFFRAAILSILLFLPLSADETKEVLARLDGEAAAFKQMTARLTRATHTAVLNDTTRETGQMWLRRNGKRVLVRTEMAEPDPRSYSFDGNTGQLYYPKINTVQIWDLGSNRSLVDQLLLLGFGSSGKELAKNYTIAVAGDETVAGRSTTRLELTPKSAKVKEQFEKLELWIPRDAGYPIQQKFHQPGGDYYLVTYSDVRINPELPESAFRLKLPPDVKREYPQK